MNLKAKYACIAMSFLLAGGCASFFPGSGPGRGAVGRSPEQRALPPIRLVDVNQDVIRALQTRHPDPPCSQIFPPLPARLKLVGMGDVLTVSVWEAAPATLFGSIKPDPRDVMSPSLPTTLPPQPVDSEGFITVPFAGRVPAAGRTFPEIEADIKHRIAGKANLPEVLVLLARSRSSTVAIVGDVTKSTPMQLTDAHERLLDAIAEAQGVPQPANKTLIQLTRGAQACSMPLETIIEDPRQNVVLQPGDVVTARYKVSSFTALGATGKNDEVPFEATGISLAQALGRSQGLLDDRSNARAVFVFRLEPRGAGHEPQSATDDGRVPVVYRFDLSDPRTLFLIQDFPVRDQDVLYVSNAPLTYVQKFLNLLFLAAYPVVTVKDLGGF